MILRFIAFIFLVTYAAVAAYGATIDKDVFLKEYKKEFDTRSDRNRADLRRLLSNIEVDLGKMDIRHIAYILATVKHETGHTYKPISEYGKGEGKTYGEPAGPHNHIYYGRGYVQLTWYANYKAQSEKLGVDLVSNPDQAMKPKIAYTILVQGMKKGEFTGVKLSTYINDQVTDYTNARKIINALDNAPRIAEYAQKFENILRRSK